MVNTEEYGSQAFGSAVLGQVSEGLNPLIELVAPRLPGNPSAETLVELAMNSGSRSARRFEDFLRGLDRLVGVSLFSDAGVLLALKSCQEVARELHRDLSSRLVTYSRRFLNTVTQLPPLSSECARLLFVLERCAEGSGVGESCAAPFMKLHERLPARLEALSRADRFSTSYVTPLLDDAAEGDLVAAVAGLLAFVETLGATAVQTEKLLRPMLVQIIHRPTTFANIDNFENKSAVFEELSGISETIDRGDLLPEARRQFVAGKYLRTLEMMGIAFEAISSLLEGLQQFETGVVFDPPSLRHLEGENYLYAMSLAARLVQMGETLDSAEKVARSAFEYATKNKVSCIDVLDEEILAAAPVVRKDVLARARLEVKMNAVEFPLSVAAKDRTMQRIPLS